MLLQISWLSVVVAPQLSGPPSPALNRREESQPTAQLGIHQRTCFFFPVTVTPMQTFHWLLWDWQGTDEEVLGKEPSELSAFYMSVIVTSGLCQDQEPDCHARHRAPSSCPGDLWGGGRAGAHAFQGWELNSGCFLVVLDGPGEWSLSLRAFSLLQMELQSPPLE